MSFTKNAFITELKDSLKDVASVFVKDNSDDYDSVIAGALPDFSRYRLYRVQDSVTIEAGKADYIAPQSFMHMIHVVYGMNEISTRKPWEQNYPKIIPEVKELHDPTNNQIILLLTPTPDAHLINCCGTDFTFMCSKLHVLSDTANNTTIRAEDKGLFLLRCQAEVMKTVAMRNSHKPVSIRDGISGTPRNSTPNALYKDLMNEFYRQTA